MKNPNFPYNHLEVLGISKLKSFIPKIKKMTANKDLIKEIKNTVSSEDLIPLVNLIANKLAENINNSGIDEQLKFIENNGWKQDDIVKYILEDD